MKTILFDIKFDMGDTMKGQNNNIPVMYSHETSGLSSMYQLVNDTANDIFSFQEGTNSEENIKIVFSKPSIEPEEKGRPT